jgi:hypothetical protein
MRLSMIHLPLLACRSLIFIIPVISRLFGTAVVLLHLGLPVLSATLGVFFSSRDYAGDLHFGTRDEAMRGQQIALTATVNISPLKN